MATGSGGSAAFSRLNRPGSGRLLTAPDSQGSSPSAHLDRSNRSGSGRSSKSTSSTPASLSPTSPMGPGLVAEHRVRPVPGSLPFTTHTGGFNSDTCGITSPEQMQKRQGLTISFSSPNMRRATVPPLSGLQLPVPAVLSGSSSSSGLYAAAQASEEKSKFLLYKNAHSTGLLKIGSLEYPFKAEDLSDQGEIGRGAFGSVNKMSFTRDKFSQVMAVKRIRSTVDEREQKELLMDLDVVMRSNDCPFIVLFFGAIFKEGDCWICMVSLKNINRSSEFKMDHQAPANNKVSIFSRMVSGVMFIFL